MFRLSRRRIVEGYEIGFLLTGDGARTIVVRKCLQALRLLRAHAPREYQRLLAHTDGALVVTTTRPLGEWLRAARLIRLNESYIAKPATQAAHVAAVVVHEVTHAWLDNRGFDYAPDRRRRIEAICYRAEATFARRLPGGDNLAEYYEVLARRVLEQTDDQWSDAAVEARDIEDLRDIGLPPWLLRIITRIIGRST